MTVGETSNRTPGQLLFRVRLFISAYAVLFILFAVKYPLFWAQILFYGLGVAGLIVAFDLIFRYGRSTASYSYKVDSLEDAGGLVNGFLASHLLPFLAPGVPTVRDSVAYGLFFLVLLIVSINSDLAHINPVLYLFGRKVVRITTNGTSRIFVCSTVPRPGETVTAVRATGGLIEAREGDRRKWRSRLNGRT